MEADWLLDEILTGLQKLYTLSLDRTPAGELLQGTAMTWMEAITRGRVWDVHRDTQRVRAAFSTLAADCTEWPKPRDFLDVLLQPEPQARLPRPTGIPETRAKRMRHLRELLGPEFHDPRAHS